MPCVPLRRGTRCRQEPRRALAACLMALFLSMIVVCQTAGARQMRAATPPPGVGAAADDVGTPRRRETRPVPTATGAVPTLTVSPQAVAEIARELNCPVCQGYDLQDCPLKVCAQMRDVIRDRLAKGERREDILAGFVAEYGPQVLNAPPREGLYLFAWLLPLFVLMGGAALVWVGWQRSTSSGSRGRDTAAAGRARQVSAESVSRLEAMVRERDGRLDVGNAESGTTTKTID